MNFLDNLVASVEFSLKNFLLVLNFCASLAGIILVFSKNRAQSGHSLSPTVSDTRLSSDTFSFLATIYLTQTQNYGLNGADSFLDPLLFFGGILGTAITVVAVLGLCGAANDRNGILALKGYAILLGILIFAQIIFGAAAYMAMDMVREGFTR